MADHDAHAVPVVPALPIPVVPLPGVSPPPPLKLSENIADNWRMWKQMWTNYSVVAELGSRSVDFQIALFLHAIGAEGLKIFNGMEFVNGEVKDLPTILRKFDTFTIGEVNETYERYVFNIRIQDPTETIDSYVTILRTLAKSCNFCDCLHDTLIRDRIVTGVRDQPTRKRLLQERNLTLPKCIDICRGAEATSSQLKVMNNDTVHGVGVRNKQSKPARRGKVTSYQSTTSRGGARQKYGSRESPPQICKFCAKSHVMKKAVSRVGAHM